MVGSRGVSGSPAGRLRVAGLACAALLALCWPWALAWRATFGLVAFGAWPHLGLFGFALASSACGLLWVRARRRSESPVAAGEARTSDLALAGLALALASASLGWDAWWHARALPADPLLTPPHALAALAALAVLAQWTWALRGGSRPERGVREAALPTPAAALLGGLVLLWLTTVGIEYLGRPNLWRGSEFYVAAAALLPTALVAFGRASGARLGASLAALVHVAALSGLYALLWLPAPSALPVGSGPAAPRFVLPLLPPLLVVPALGVDGLLALTRRLRGLLGRLLAAGLLGGAFVALLLAVHWPLAGALVPRMDGWPLARAWPPAAGAGAFRTEFWNLDPGTLPLAERLLLAVVLAAVASGLGLWLGGRLRRPPARP